MKGSEFGSLLSAMEPTTVAPVAEPPEDPATDATRPDRPTVVFAMEQHLGHRTYYENLRRTSATTAVTRCGSRSTTPSAIDSNAYRSRARSRRPCRRGNAVRRGVRSVDADVHVFNTQVPAVLGGRAARSKPYIAITDVTPKQYDRMAAGYDHRPDRAGPVGWAKHQLNLKMFLGASWCVGWSNWACDSMVDDYGVDRARDTGDPAGGRHEGVATRPGAG